MKYYRQSGKALLAIGTLLLASCAPFQPSSYPAPEYPPSGSPPYTPPGSQQPAEKTPAEKQQSTEIKPVESRSPDNNAAITSLLEQGWQLHYQGDYDRSNAVAERAQRLDAGYAEIYLLLASNYFALSELRIAEQLARQGLPMAGNLWDIERRLKQLLAQINEAQR